ncbi:MAG: shikimate dehydrogenase [Polyangiales bacterium]
MSSPQRFHVIGDPVAHSISPQMQTAALKSLGLPHTYEALRVAPYELAAVLDRVRRGAIHGLNVTVPHKVAVLALLDQSMDEVGVTGAANTVWVDRTGRLVGANTDVDGLRADLLGEGVTPQRVLVIGAGGAARACVYACSMLGAEVSVGARRDDEAHRLTRSLGRGAAVPWATLDAGAPYDLVINATSAGMAGGPDGTDVAAAWERAPKTGAAVAYDLIYRPPAGMPTTLMLARAAAQGHRALDGLGMLVEQGVRALSIFLGTPLDSTVRTAMRQAATEALRLPHS